MATTLAFTEEDIRRVADARSFERGQGYLDAISDLWADGAQVTATVHGRATYWVSLSCGDEGLTGRCSCPHGMEGFFCKHCVAVGRPADALAVYLKAIEPLRSQTGDQVYQQVARLLLSMRACHEALGSTGEFRRYLTALRADQKRKRNLMKILDESGL